MELSAGRGRLRRRAVLPGRAQQKPLIPLPKRVHSANPDTLIGGVVNTNLNSAGCPCIDPDKTYDNLVLTRRRKQELISYARESKEEYPQVVITDVFIFLAGPEDIEKNSVAEINSPETDPREVGGVNDSRLGVNNQNSICGTCHYTSTECPGHLGHINLAFPVYHPYYLRVIIRVLNSICLCCSCLYIPVEKLREDGFFNLTGVNRLKAIEKESSSLRCRTSVEGSECTARPIFNISKSKEQGKIMYTTKKKKKGGETTSENKPRELPIEKVEEILKAISTEDAEALMFENGVRPESMILRKLIVIPTNARPPIYKDGMIWQDDFTNLYKEIIKTNNSLKDLGKFGREAEREDKIERLTNSIKSLIDNSDGKYSQGKQKDMQNIQSRVSGKKGVFRGYLGGKRVDFSARTVISPDPSLKFGQIRIPRIWQSQLTVKVRIHNYNRNAWQEKINTCLKDNEPVPISYYIPAHGKYKKQKIKTDQNILSKVVLRDGDVIYRWLQDGDYIAANRNPTLHRQGFMGSEVVLNDSLTIGLHISLTTPYNADFDGDEMNIHAPQTQQAVEELRDVMNVRNCIMNPQANKNSMGVVYDGLVAAYLLTKKEIVEYTDKKTGQKVREEKNVIISPVLWADCLMLMTETGQFYTLDARLEKHKVPKYTGKALFSALLPQDFYYNRGGVLIIDGILLKGTITKAHIGPVTGSIVQIIYKDYGEERTKGFLTDAPFVLARWFDSRGYTVGLKDCYPKNKDYRKKIEAEIAKVKLQVESMYTRMNDPLEEERREKAILAQVNIAKTLGMKIGTEELHEDNNIRIAAFSGAKGSEANIAQITGIVGQQSISGGRIPMTITDAGRCLPFFKVGETDPVSRGFCENSFFTGLSPAEMVFVGMATRKTVMDSSVTVPTGGTIQASVTQALEDYKIAFDGSVRDSNNNIIQFVYGNDGFSAEGLERTKRKLVTGEEEITSFSNILRHAEEINAEYGYYTELNEEQIDLEEEREIAAEIEPEETEEM